MSVKTLQRWDREGRLKPAARTPGNRRLYPPEQLNQVLNRISKIQPVTIASLRVSSQAQKQDMVNPKAVLEQFWIARGMAVDEWISEISGSDHSFRPVDTGDRPQRSTGVFRV